MAMIRAVEERLARSFMAGLIHGACHTYIGEEAIATGVCACLTEDDSIFSTHRGYGHALAKGVPPNKIIAELYGRETGISNGRGGSMHLFAPEIGLMGTSGIVGPCILQATGAGYSSKLMNTGAVGVAFFGDGAVGNGAFHEGLNLAAIFDLPVLFVCENNLYATEVPFSYASRNTNIASRASNYGIPGIQVDGNDVLAVQAASSEAISRARTGEGPTLIEAKTYRTRPHAEGMSPTGVYRSEKELEMWKTKDPIPRFRDVIISDRIMTEKDLDQIDADVRSVVDTADKEASASPWPDKKTVAKYVYKESK